MYVMIETKWDSQLQGKELKEELKIEGEMEG